METKDPLKELWNQTLGRLPTGCLWVLLILIGLFSVANYFWEDEMKRTGREFTSFIGKDKVPNNTSNCYEIQLEASNEEIFIGAYLKVDGKEIPTNENGVYRVPTNWLLPPNSGHAIFTKQGETCRDIYLKPENLDSTIVNRIKSDCL